jgi:Leucine-rich repeat (LRR) protein
MQSKPTTYVFPVQQIANVLYWQDFQAALPANRGITVCCTLKVRSAFMLNFVWMSRRNLGMAALAFTVLLSFTGCGRKFSVSVNEQMLYDPRPSSALVVVADAGLQSCINVLVRDRQITEVSQIQVLACPMLEIRSLTGIDQLINLRFLDLAGNELVNLDGLANARSLSSVNTPDNRLQDISAILQIPTLSSAVMTGNLLIPCSQLAQLQSKLANNLLAPDSCVP